MNDVLLLLSLEWIWYPSLTLFIVLRLLDNILEPMMNYTIQQSAISNFNLPLLYIIFTKINGTTIYFYSLVLSDWSRKRADEDIARMSGEYVTIAVILDQSENFTFPRGCNVLLPYCYPVELDWQCNEWDITQSMLTWRIRQDSCSLARSRRTWLIQTKYLPARKVKIN